MDPTPINRPNQFLLPLSWRYLGTMPFPLSKGSNSGGKVEPLKVIFLREIAHVQLSKVSFCMLDK